MSFSIYRYSQKTLQELDLIEFREPNRGTEDASLIFFYYRGESPIAKAKTIFMAEGKKIFYGKKMEDLYRKQEYEDFIVDVDEDGREKRLSCKQKDEDIHLKLTPIFFKEEVLKKYYDNPKCTVQQGSIRHPAWRLQADIDNDDYVVVYLYKLFFLPHEEQLHWRSHNIPREGRKMSSSFFNTTIMGQFSEPENRVDKFKFLYPEINQFWMRNFGFNLYSDLHDDDRYVLNGLNDIIKNEKDLDDKVGSLAKILVDSIQEGIILHRSGLDQDLRKRLTGGINRLEAFLKQQTVIENGLASFLVEQLRWIQKFRSRSDAHRKGSDYNKLIEEIPKIKSNPQGVFKDILDKVNDIFIQILALNETERV